MTSSISTTSPTQETSTRPTTNEVFPVSTEELIRKLWVNYRAQLEDEGLPASKLDKPPVELDVLLRMVDDMLRHRIVEALERVRLSSRRFRLRTSEENRRG